MPYFKGRRGGMCAKPGKCHICELPIPDFIASRNHPLYGTVDHVIPRSADGPDVVRNRKPAHRMCNERKGSRLELGKTEAQMLRLAILTQLVKVEAQLPQKPGGCWRD